MKNVKLIISVLCLCSTLHCLAQEVKQKRYPILPTDTVGARYVGTFNDAPVFCIDKSSINNLYVLERVNSDSVTLTYLRTMSIPLRSNVRLIWVNNEIEIYTNENFAIFRNSNFFIARGGQIDTVVVALNSIYDNNYEPFVLAEDRRYLLAVQPEGYKDYDERGWYYDSIMLIDMQQPQLKIQKLPITAKRMQRVGSYLYYQGGEGEFEHSLLRVQIPNWDKIDTLLKFVDYWFVKDSIVYAQIGGYFGQDKWLDPYGDDPFVAYSIQQGKCAIISEQSPRGIQPIFFDGAFYTINACFNAYPGERCRSRLSKIEVPTSIRDFPYKQTLYPKKR